MKRTLLATCAVLALATAPALAQQKTVKIGFISTFSGPVAAIGNDMRNSFELALDHLGRELRVVSATAGATIAPPRISWSNIFLLRESRGSEYCSSPISCAITAASSAACRSK